MVDFRTHSRTKERKKEEENKCLLGMSNSTADRQKKRKIKRDPSL